MCADSGGQDAGGDLGGEVWQTNGGGGANKVGAGPKLESELTNGSADPGDPHPDNGRAGMVSERKVPRLHYSKHQLTRMQYRPPERSSSVWIVH